jgi:hypothetical protein
MVRNVHTSRKSSSRKSMASKVLRDPESSGPSRSVAASILAEAKPVAKKRAEKKAEEKSEKKTKAKKE